MKNKMRKVFAVLLAASLAAGSIQPTQGRVAMAEEVSSEEGLPLE